MKKNLIGVMATGIEMGCILLLAAIGLKRNNDCYKAEMKLIDAECALGLAQVDSILKDAQIKALNKKLEELNNSK